MSTLFILDMLVSASASVLLATTVLAPVFALLSCAAARCHKRAAGCLNEASGLVQERQIWSIVITATFLIIRAVYLAKV